MPDLDEDGDPIVPETAPAPAAPSSEDRIAAILERLADRSGEGPIKQINIAAYKPITPFNPKGLKKRTGLARPSYMNGHRLRIGTMRDEEIAGFNQLRAGRYNNNKWVVIETDASDEGSAVNLYVPNKSVEDRLLMARSAPNGLVSILELIIAEQAEQDRVRYGHMAQAIA